MYISENNKKDLVDFIYMHNNLNNRDLDMVMKTFNIKYKQYENEPYELLRDSVINIASLRIEKTTWADSDIKNYEINVYNDINLFLFLV